jgi:hypothetical protein
MSQGRETFFYSRGDGTTLGRGDKDAGVFILCPGFSQRFGNPTPMIGASGPGIRSRLGQQQRQHRNAQGNPQTLTMRTSRHPLPFQRSQFLFNCVRVLGQERT